MLFPTALIARDFDRAAHRYETEAALQCRILSTLATQVIRDVPATSRVLDAGCATGFLATRIPHPLIGVDLAPAMCAQAKQRMPCAVGHIASLPLKNHCVDAVVCASVLQWVDSPAHVLAEFYRVLTPGGHVFLSFFGPRTLQELSYAYTVAGLRPRVSPFMALHDVCTHALAAGFTLTTSQATLASLSFPSVAALMRHLKTIGATDKQSDRNKHLLTPRVLATIEQHYPRSASGVEASFDVCELTLRAPPLR